MASGSRENSLVRAVARWVKGWAESVLREPDTTVLPVEGSRAPRETETVSVPVPAQENAGGPPEHWLQLVRSKRPGPPADWVERVRKGAPHLLEGLELDRKRPVPVMRAVPAPQSRPRVGLGRVGTPPRREEEARPSLPPALPMREFGESWLVRPAETQVEGDATPSMPRRSPAPSVTVPPSGEHLSRQSRERGPERPAPDLQLRETPRGGLFLPSKETAPSTRSTGAREVARSTRARGFSLRPLPETSFPERSPGPARFHEQPSAEYGNAPPLREERDSWPGRAREDSTPPLLPPSPSIPARLMAAPLAVRSSSLMPSELAQRELSFLREEGSAEVSSRPDVALLSDVSPSWPEPPELPSIEPTDPLAVLRDWERLRRLEREQRGE